MENKLSTTIEGAAQVVANVLAENTKKNQFLKNVGFQNVRPRSSEESTETELEGRKGPMLSFVRRWLICQIKCKNLSRQGLWTESR
jgi:hypothetical protein